LVETEGQSGIAAFPNESYLHRLLNRKKVIGRDRKKRGERRNEKREKGNLQFLGEKEE